jgi:predicted Zn-dependent protease
MSTRKEALARFLAADPDDAFTRYAFALELIAEGARAEGVAALRETLRRTPEYVPAWHMLAQSLAADGAREEAEAVYREGIATARAAGESHAASEMQQELDELQDDA